MNSREGFPNPRAVENSRERISPNSVASDRAAKAYEKAFLESANSNESKLKLLEERMKRPPAATATITDAVAAGNCDTSNSDDDSEDEQKNFGVHYSNPSKKQKRNSGVSDKGVSPEHNIKNSPSNMLPSSSTGNHMANIEAYFPVTDGHTIGTAQESPAPAVALFASGGTRKENNPPHGWSGSIGSRGAQGNRTESELTAALEAVRQTAKKDADAFAKKTKTLEQDLKAEKEKNEALRCDFSEATTSIEKSKQAEAQRMDGVKRMAVKLAQFERVQARREMTEVGSRLGSVSVQRTGAALQEVWEDGEAFTDLDRRTRALQAAKEASDEQRKSVKKLLPPPGAEPTEESNQLRAEYVLSEEIHKTRVSSLKKEEDSISRERELLEREKQAYIRVLKRARDEDASRFNQHPLLGNRYVLMNMLGRGGFSEVYKAFDVVEMREVACKLHQLSPQWNEARKQTYVRHAQRECMIHKRLRHANVVEMIDVFEVDRDSFCTVLELCTGDDLDAKLKSSGPIGEREARVILAQVFAGLNYLNQGPKKIIHYDLKPGNILFDAAGRVKITDFGLSKVDERGMMNSENGGSLMDNSGMELTSQGAGTYWYLPPECFETGPSPPRISSKVDTWSCGVILYQMLFGKRPFGHDQSQEQILHSGTILNAKQVEFPSSGLKVSTECKHFITKCLARKQQDRPDVPAAAKDAFMTYARSDA